MPLVFDKDKLEYRYTTETGYYPWQTSAITATDCSGFSAASITSGYNEPIEIQHLSVPEYISLKVEQKIKEHDKKLYEFLLQNRMINIPEQEFLSIFEEE